MDKNLRLPDKQNINCKSFLLLRKISEQTFSNQLSMYCWVEFVKYLDSIWYFYIVLHS